MVFFSYKIATVKDFGQSVFKVPEIGHFGVTKNSAILGLDLLKNESYAAFVMMEKTKMKHKLSILLFLFVFLICKNSHAETSKFLHVVQIISDAPDTYSR